MANIYTNLASHNSTYVPTEQKMPFQAYAAVGAHQQKRGDKLYEDMAALDLELKNYRGDDAIAANAYKEFHNEMQQLSEGLSTGEIDTNAGYKKMYALNAKKNAINAQGGKGFALKTRYNEDITAKKNITTSAGKHAGKEDWWNAQYNVNSEDSPFEIYENGEFKHLPEVNKQSHIDQAGLEKRMVDNLLRMHPEILPGSDEYEVLTKDITREDGYKDRVNYLISRGIISEKNTPVLSAALLDELSTDTALHQSLKDEATAEYFQRLKQTNPLEGQPGHLTERELKSMTEDYERNYSDDIANKMLESKVWGASTIAAQSSQTANSKLITDPNYKGRNTPAAVKEKEAEISFLSTTGAIMPGKEFNYATIKNSNAVNKEIILGLQTKAENDSDGDGLPDGLTTEEHKTLRTLEASTAVDDLYLENIIRKHYDNPAVLDEASKMINEMYENNTQGYDIYGSLSQAQWTEKNIDKVQDWIRVAMNSDEASWGDHITYMIENMVPDVGLDAENSNWKKENNDLVRATGSKLRGLVNTLAQEDDFGTVYQTISDQYWDEKTKVNRDGRISESNDSFQESVNDNTTGYRIVGSGAGAIGSSPMGSVANVIEDLTTKTGLPYKVETNLIQQDDGSVFQIMAKLVVDEDQPLNDKQKEAAAQHIPKNYIITPIGNGMDSFIEDSASKMRESVKNQNNASATSIRRQADLMTANLHWGKEFTNVKKAEQLGLWKSSDIMNGSKISEPILLKTFKDGQKIYVRKISDNLKYIGSPNDPTTKRIADNFEITQMGNKLDADGKVIGKEMKVVFPYSDAVRIEVAKILGINPEEIPSATNGITSVEDLKMAWDKYNPERLKK